MVNCVIVVLGGDGGEDVLVVMVMVEDWVLIPVIAVRNGMTTEREMLENSPFFCQRFYFLSFFN